MAEEKEKANVTEEETQTTPVDETVQNEEGAETEAAGEATEEKEPTLEERIASLEQENADLKDQLLRRAADFDNYRKRMLKEKQDTYDFANANLLGDLLESLDNFDRTIDAAKDATDVKSIADGIKMINTSLVKMLEDKYNLKGYGEKGDIFNPDDHEAIGRVEDPEATEETLKEVYLKGYKLKDRVIRHAKVMVSVPKTE